MKAHGKSNANCELEKRHRATLMMGRGSRLLISKGTFIVSLGLSTESSQRLLQTDGDNIFGPRDQFIQLAAENLFVDDCCSFLMSKASLHDEKISQLEYTELLDVVCIEQGACKESERLTYDSININLQDIFLKTACPEGSEKGPSFCFFDFNRDGNEYGLVADLDRIQIVDERVTNLCSSSYEVIQEQGVLGSDGIDGDEQAQPLQGSRPTEMSSMTPTMSPSRSPFNHPAAAATDPEIVIHEPPSAMPSATLESSALDEEGAYKLTSGAITITISVSVVILFGVAVVYSGGTRNKDYDINQVQPLNSGR